MREGKGAARLCQDGGWASLNLVRVLQWMHVQLARLCVQLLCKRAPTCVHVANETGDLYLDKRGGDKSHFQLYVY